jgi:hypothetical protein
METNIKAMTEKASKYFLKNKNIWITMALFAVLMIMESGSITLASSVELQSQVYATQSELLEKIMAQKFEVEALLKENEIRLRELKSQGIDLVRKGDYFSKSIYPSTQIFFTYSHFGTEKSSNRTAKEFKETIDAEKRYYGAKGITNREWIDGEIGKIMSKTGNGVAADNEEFREAIEVGANIKSIVPVLPSINPSASANVSEPKANIGALPGTVSPTAPSILGVDAPPFTPPTSPGGVSVVVTMPTPVEKIVVVAPDIKPSGSPLDKDIPVNPPVAPAGYDPSYISVPEAPSSPTTTVPDMPSINFISMSNGNSIHTEIDAIAGTAAGSKGGIQNGIISGVSVIDGTFMVKREKLFSSGSTALTATNVHSTDTFTSTANNSYSYSYAGYIAYSPSTVGVGRATGTTGLQTIGTTIGDKYAISYANNYADSASVQRIVGGNSITFNNGKFRVARESDSDSVYLGEFLHMDIHGSATSSAIKTKIETTVGYINTLGIRTPASDNAVPAWDDIITNYTKYTSNVIAWLNTNDIALEGGNLSLTNMYHHTSTLISGIAINTGKIQIRPYKNGATIYDGYNSVFVVSSEQQANRTQYVMYNKGEITTSTQNTGVFTINNGWYRRGNATTYSNSSDSYIVNKGIIEMTGNHSIGVYGQFLSWNVSGTNRGILTLDFMNGIDRKPMQLYGDESIGLYILSEFNAANITGNFHVDIGEADIGNKSISVSGTDTNGGNTITDYWSGNTSTVTVDGSVGILSYRDLNLTSHGIVIHNKTIGNIGVAPQKKAAYTWSMTGGGLTSNWNIAAANPNLNLGFGYIKINGGTDNIGIFAREGNVTTTGSVELTDGTGNLAIDVKDYIVGVRNVTTTGSVENTVVLFADNGTISVTDNVELLGLNVSGAVTGNQNNILAAYAVNSGEININNSGSIGTFTSPNIEVTGMELGDASGQYRGLALMADGGTINGKKNYIKVLDGSAGIASINSGEIDITGTTVYVNNGYAIYSDGTGTIDITDGKIILDGNSVAFDLDLVAINPLTLTDTEINVVSNDVIAVNLKNVTTALSVNSLKGSIITALGGTVDITDDGIHDKYKIAAVDGGTLNIDTDIDKADSDPDSKGYFYYKRFLGQRLTLNVSANKTVLASIDSAEAATYFNGQVVGLEMNSSNSAASATDAQINLAAGSKVIADRADSGNGAIGLYMNFGSVDLAATSKLGVEKITGGGNVVNAKAVGIYAVNGSTVNNAGDIEVGGDTSIGILGMAYREKGTPIINEFGSTGIFTAQGKANITNSGKITLDGEGTIGIYAYNNNALGTKADTVVTNTAAGEITVGDSNSSNAAVGIYGEKATISNLGKVSVGAGGVAIYAKEGSEITNLGELVIGVDGIGVMADGTSTITATSVTLTGTEMDIDGKTGFFYKGTGLESKSIAIDVDARAFDKGTAIYIEDMNVTSSETLDIGKDGVGIFVKSTTSDINTGTNTGTINLTTGKTGAVGMYTNSAIILNDITTGVINVNDALQIGMYAEGTDSEAINEGTINLNADGATGIYIKDDAITELSGNKITFSGKSSVGVFAEDATVEVTENVAHNQYNENKNILIYGKDGASVSIATGKTLTVNGDVDGYAPVPTPGHKSVGIYLENETIANNYSGPGTISVLNEAIGIYSKGDNTLNVTVTATGDKTTGVFIEGASTITGTVTANGTATAGAVGVYGDGGKVTVGAAGLTLKTDAGKGTGMYLINGAYADSGIITVENTVTTLKNIGVYYSKGTASGTITNGSDILITKSNSIGIYAADGIILANTEDITSVLGESNNIASYVGGNSTLTSSGDITVNDDDGIGIYVEKGTATNSGTITLNGAPSAPTTSVVGMISEAKIASDTASVKNAGTIDAGNNLGMYIAGAGTNSGENTGSIVTGTGTGVYVNGSGNGFNGSGGSITSDALGIYLKDTDANKITAGTLNITAGGVGVFGENAKIDFAVSVTGAEAVGVAAKTNSVISSNITTGQDSVGVYVLDNTVSFNGASITTGTKTLGKTSIGILLDSAVGTYTMNNVTVSTQDGVGIYLDGTVPGINLTHSGTINTVGGVGIYVDNGTTLTTGTTVLNINGGIGVYVDGGTANLGTAGSLTFNFLAGGGTGVYNNGGTINLGGNITLTGTGTLAATANGSLSSSGNLYVGEGATGILGKYDNGVASGSPQNITNNGTITAVSGGIGVAAIKGTTNPGDTITINNNGTITISGESSTNKPSIGIYTDIADIVNTGAGGINVGNKGIGIYSSDNGVPTSITSDNITITGTDGIGVYIKGTNNGLLSNSIISTNARNTGVVLESTATGNINAGTISLGNESVGVMATVAANSTIDGTITVGNSSSSKSAIGVVADGSSTITLAGTVSITVGTGGIGVYAEGAGTSVSGVNVSNITIGADGIYMYSKNSALSFTGNITANNKTGIVAEGAGTITGIGSAITAQNGGVGIYVKGGIPTFTGITVAVQTGTASKYSIGIYYDGVSSIGTTPTITQTGSYTIEKVLNNSTGTTGGISLGNAGATNQIGVMAKDNSNLTVTGIISVGGDNNIGVYGENSSVNTTNNISVLNSAVSTDKSTASIGIVLNGKSYLGTGDFSIGDYSIGIFGKGMTSVSTITQNGTTMSVGKNGLGIYGEGAGSITANMSNIAVGTDNAIGVYAKGLNSLVTGNMSIGANTSLGIVNKGNGNVSYTGDITIANKASTGSIGIYKIDGTGTITTSAGNWVVGNSGYGIYLKQSAGQQATINNSANMILGTSSVGIFSDGNNTISNTGNITVGITDVQGDHSKVQNHLNSVGIYIDGGTIAQNTGTITVNHDHSVGIYGSGIGTRFTNYGNINADNGGVGILVRNNAVAINAIGANITLGSISASCGAITIGMAAYNATIINDGTITVNDGIGMNIGIGGMFENNGTIILNNGVGIEGAGITVNGGTIIVNGGTAMGPGGVGAANVGAVEIKPDGTIIINDKYVSIGGTLSTVGAIVVNGAYADVTTGTPLFNASSVSGEVKLLPNFATTGNGISYEIKGFVNTALGVITGSKITPVTSPMFVAKVTNNGDLVIAKRPYADLTIGEQFYALYNGLDNVLKNSGGIGRDADVLMGMNAYLNGIYNESGNRAFTEETQRVLAEFRGDIYTTSLKRILNVQSAFNKSFEELESSYNFTKDTVKYSVIYQDGGYEDETVGVDNYDYKIHGLYMMKEYEGKNYAHKYGYMAGFAVSKFEFDDAPTYNEKSTEDIYSLRLGLYNSFTFGESNFLTLRSKLEIGANIHEAKRKIELEKTYTNNGKYESYNVMFDNRLSMEIYKSYKSEIKLYGDLNLEYGYISKFKEKAKGDSGLELQIEGRDYFRAEMALGVKAAHRIHVGNNFSVKITGDISYGYQFGNGDTEYVKAKVYKGDEGTYNLIRPFEEKGKLKGIVGVTFEKANHYGVTFDVEATKHDNKASNDIKYSLRFNYKFGN